MAKDSMKYIIYSACYLLRNILNPFLDFQEVSILSYHSIGDTQFDTVVSASNFEKQLAYLKRKGFSFVSIGAVLRWLDGDEGSEDANLHKAVAITFDDGYADFETIALPILEKFSAPVTLFVIGDAESRASGAGATDTAEIQKNLGNDIPLLTPEALERIQKNSLVEIGYHSLTHANLAKLSGTELQREVEKPLMTSAASGARLRYFAYPGGNYSSEAIEAVKGAGYDAALSIKRRLISKNAKKQPNRYLLPRTVVTKNMQPWLVGVHVTKAISWYRAITGTVK